MRRKHYTDIDDKSPLARTENGKRASGRPQARLPLIVLLLVMMAMPCAAQLLPNMIVEHYTKDAGLPSNTVYSSFKDKDGFIWLSTWHGLCSFDGNKFTPFITRQSHKSDIPPRKVRNIVEDKDGHLWVRNTDNHLYLFDKATETFHDIYTDLQRLARNVQVIKIQLLPNGHLLVLTRNKDLYEVTANAERKVAVKRIYESHHNIDPTTLKLRRNVVGETNEYVYWLGKNLTISVVQKSGKTSVLKSLSRKINPSCFRYKDRYVCLGTEKGEIYIINTATRQTTRYAFSGINAPISSVNVIDGRVYFTTSAGLFSFVKGATPKLLTAQAAGATSTFTDLYGNLWLCAEGKQIVRIDTKSNSSKTFALPSDSLFAETKFKDAGQNGLFILLRNGEVWRYDHTNSVMLNLNKQTEFNSSVTPPHFFDIDIDGSGILWLSSTSTGLYKVCFLRNSFSFLFPHIFNLDNSNENDGVRALYQVRSGDLWVGTRKGELYCIDNKTHKVKQKFSKEEVGSVYHIMEDDKGRLWFSTKGAGLVMAVPDAMAQKGLRLTRFTNSRTDRNSISSNRVYYTYQDSHGRIWVCTFYGGLNLIEQRGGSVVFRHKRNGFRHYPNYELYTDIRSIAEDKEGRLWVGTTDGLMSFDGRFRKVEDINFETYREQRNTGVLGNDIFTMFKDHRGSIWMGVFGSGLNRIERYDKKARCPILREYTQNEMQGGDVITSITEDKTHCLWICTENGLASLKEGATFVKSYGRASGFPEVTLEDNTSACLSNGNILIGSRQGLLQFNPSIVRKENERSFNTFITNLKVANRELWNFDPPILESAIKYAHEIHLKHDQATFTIEFASPYYADNNLIPYTYILDGYEKEWHTSGTSRTASYANVPPGHYKFRVKVDDGVSSERTLDVIISPPWWASWWAYTFYALLFALIAYGILRLVLYMIRMRNEVYINDRLAELKIRFFTNVSHELRTPLSLIKGPIEELKTKERLSPTGKEYLNLIDRNARKMLRLVNQILDFRKIQNGKMKMHVSLVDVNHIIETLMQEFRMLAEEHDIAFVFDKPEDRVMAWCDAEKIGVVLNNLINNAFKYTDDGGKISVVLEHDFDRHICTIRVEDDGASIPKSQLELIFERFSQANNKTSDDTAFAGSGIGLSLSREYVSLHHGRIWAENLEEGKGVVFSVELPTGKENFDENDIEMLFDDTTAENDTTEKPEEEPLTDATHSDDEQEDRPTILLIEDNADMCRMLQLQLGAKYRTFTAHDGAEGLKKIDHQHPDVIITDLLMPGMNGMEVLRSVRQNFSVSHIPVIVLTSKNTEEDKMNAVKAGANAFISKPFSSSYLIARIEQLLEEQRIFQRKMVVQTTVESSSDGNKDEYEQHLVKKDIEFMRKIHEVIERNLNANDFNIDTIAGTIGLSRSVFFKKLKSLTGFAPVDFVKEIRLNKAAKLIETTDDSITEIAYSVGFRDAGYFGKCFRKKYGKTPKEYRNDIRK